MALHLPRWGNPNTYWHVTFSIRLKMLLNHIHIHTQCVCETSVFNPLDVNAVKHHRLFAIQVVIRAHWQCSGMIETHKHSPHNCVCNTFIRGKLERVRALAHTRPVQYDAVWSTQVEQSTSSTATLQLITSTPNYRKTMRTQFIEWRRRCSRLYTVDSFCNDQKLKIHLKIGEMKSVRPISAIFSHSATAYRHSTFISKVMNWVLNKISARCRSRTKTLISNTVLHITIKIMPSHIDTNVDLSDGLPYTKYY